MLTCTLNFLKQDLRDRNVIGIDVIDTQYKQATNVFFFEGKPPTLFVVFIPRTMFSGHFFIKKIIVHGKFFSKGNDICTYNYFVRKREKESERVRT